VASAVASASAGEPGATPGSDKTAPTTKKQVRKVDVDTALKTAGKAVYDGRYEQAIDVLLESAKAAPRDPRVQRSLALAYAKSFASRSSPRSKKGAQTHFKRFAELSPSDPSVSALRTQLQSNGINVR